MNPNYEILEQIYRIDVDAGAATTDQRLAQKEMSELAKKTKVAEEVIEKTRMDMAFLEGELRRQYKKMDELEERKQERSSKLFASKTDDEHRSLKREVDNLDRDIRETGKRIEDSESKIESFKSTLGRTETELSSSLTASADERRKAEEAEGKSGGRISELNVVRDNYLSKLDDRLGQHYLRVAKLTRNPNGPVTFVNKGACGNCHIGLAPQLLNTLARAKEVEFCPSCNHILLPENKK